MSLSPTPSCSLRALSFHSSARLRDPASFPTRRSSDLPHFPAWSPDGETIRFNMDKREDGTQAVWEMAADGSGLHLILASGRQDRKSTRLNSSHRCISYAVFCLKKKKTIEASGITCCRC